MRSVRRVVFRSAMLAAATSVAGWGATAARATAAETTTSEPRTETRTGPTTSAPARGLTLREVLNQAVVGNPDLLRERVAIDAARANVIVAEGQFDLVLTGDATFVRRVTPSISGSGSDFGAGFANSVTVDLGLTRALESGGRITLGAQGIGTNTNSIQPCGGNGVVCTYYTSGLTLAFTHPLLRGFGTEITLANLRKQRILHDTELLNRQARAAIVIRDVVTAYWELGYAADDLEIRRSAVTLAEEQRRYTQAQVDVGRLGLADLAALDRAIADRQQDVALAEQTLLGRALDLERLAGRAVPATFVPAAAIDRPSHAETPHDPAAETAHALESSPQLRATRAGLALSAIDIQTAQAMLRPQLDFTGSVGTGGRRLGFGDAWSQAGRFEDLNWSAGLIFQLPVQNRVARGGAEVARAADEKVHIDVADLELGIRDAVVRLTAEARVGARRGDLARAAIGYAQKNLEAERARFEVGRSTNNDVLLRQQELKTAEIQVARAAADLANAETALAALTGAILERYGVVLRGS
jgi:outer membrane protein TolC